MASSDPNKPIVLATLPTEILASFLIARLREEGIRTEMVGALTSGFRAEAPGGVKILVRSEDLDRAREVLAAFEKHDN